PDRSAVLRKSLKAVSAAAILARKGAPNTIRTKAMGRRLVWGLGKRSRVSLLEERCPMATAVANHLRSQMFINGAWCDAESGKTLGVINPADESVLAEVAYGTRADGKRAVAAAARAFPEWSVASAYDRAKVLKKTAELLRERADQVARTLTQEQGKPLTEARLEALHAADTFEWFAEEGKRSYGRIIPPANVAKRYYA